MQQIPANINKNNKYKQILMNPRSDEARSGNFNKYKQMLTKTNKYKQILTNINKYQQILTKKIPKLANTNKYQQIPTHINQYQRISTNIDENQQ